MSLVTEPKPDVRAAGLVYSETPREDLVDPEEASHPWYQRTIPLAGIALVLVLILNVAFWRSLAMTEKTVETTTPSPKKTAGAFDIRNIIGSLLGIYGVILVLAGLFGDTASVKTGGINANLWTGLGLAVASVVFLVWARLKSDPGARARRAR